MAKDKLFLDTDVVLDHLSDRQPCAGRDHAQPPVLELTPTAGAALTGQLLVA